MGSFIVNFIKGMFIGIGGVLPGLSGGALAAVFGLYEPLIHFVSHVGKDFKKNVKFFLPVVVGGAFGVFALSHLLSYLLDYHLSEVSVFFVGCMLGVFPSLVRQAGKHGRKVWHVFLAVGAAFVAFWLLLQLSAHATYAREANFFTWVMSGGIIGLGVTFPGMSPSNFLMFLALYQPLNEGISQLNLMIVLPVMIGGLLSFLLTAKLVDYLLKVAYPIVFHLIIGFVITSTVMIVPTGITISPLIIGLFVVGACVGLGMSQIEKSHE